jgi:hypothetical protein
MSDPESIQTQSKGFEEPNHEQIIGRKSFWHFSAFNKLL